ncbi:hypothetical protein K432DRAFT_151001 [Lepidopterella palustris CBS 459.81]|uniref:Uncharacterized protein n=1 Tax=Lepidopterella palustris CBS 459.81 TaxID=1314670 RepID=A0A8E2JBA5_9PEZI|nr:hypothetical protein K432DRAFT_151001 [Lepidopterella palustris CBS 459.81]
MIKRARRQKPYIGPRLIHEQKEKGTPSAICNYTLDAPLHHRVLHHRILPSLCPFPLRGRSRYATTSVQTPKQYVLHRAKLTHMACRAHHQLRVNRPGRSVRPLSIPTTRVANEQCCVMRKNMSCIRRKCAVWQPPSHNPPHRAEINCRV